MLIYDEYMVYVSLSGSKIFVFFLCDFEYGC